MPSPLLHHTVANVSITLTGERRNDHFTFIVNGNPVDSTHGRLMSLIELVLARAASGRRHVRQHPRDVYRLRRAIADAVGTELAYALIESGSGQEYRLAIKDLSQVQLTECFFELVDIGVVSAEQAAKLREICVVVPWNP